MAVTNEALQAEIGALHMLLEQSDKHQAERHEQITKLLETLNGRQRKNTAGISTNRGAIRTLETRIELAVEDARQDTNRKATIVGVVGFLEALAAFIGGLLTKP